jgi:DNA modification methylase
LSVPQRTPAEEQLRTAHRLFLGFDSSRMRQVDDSSVHCAITSPPYWNIKDYGNPRQIGYRDTLLTYFRKLGRVWAECVRVLHPGCRLCINVGDEYLRASEKIQYQIIPLHAHLVNSIMNQFNRKLVYLGSIVWQKIPTTRTSGGASVMGSYGYPRNGYVSYNYEYIAIFKKLGKAPDPPEGKEEEKIELKEWRQLFNGIWRFNGARQQGGIAIFPDDLPRRLMRMFTYRGDTVLDPFLGSGTTTRVAFEMGRNSVGYEVGFNVETDEWMELIKKKTHYYDVPQDLRGSVFQVTRRPEKGHTTDRTLDHMLGRVGGLASVDHP